MTQIYNRPYIAPLHERASTYERQQAPYYPRDTRRPEPVKSWSPPRSPASDSSKRSREPEEMYRSRTEHNQKAPREQLPSLSSLFGNTPHQPPAQSPYSDRPSPIFPSTHPSPLDGRHSATPVHPDRPFESNSNSYFHRPAQPPAPTLRPETVERRGFPPRPRSAINKPESPRYEGQQPFPTNTSRPQAPQGPPVNSWPPQSQSNHPEYFSRDTSSSFARHGDHLSGTHRPEETRSTYRDGSHITPVTPSFPPTPASTIVGEVATLQDGLGPKIWTGTQFLPRFVRQADVPSEGMCYFYDDGTHCKTVIDGEIVNAHWGVTKAGKPRKRLAIACITCREKKIKCDPDYPRCVQCEKFGRVCRFKNAPRGGQGSPDTPPADNDDTVSRPSSSRADWETFKAGGRENSGEPVSPRRVVRQSPPASEEQPPKRQRTSYNHFTPVPSEGSPQTSVHEAGSSPAAWQGPVAPVDYDVVNQSRVNPYTARPAIVSELVDIFLMDTPETLSLMFPQAAFKSWFTSLSEKSADDLMLMYSVLAISTIFSTKQEHKLLCAQYAAISRFACEHPRSSIQLVQARLLLSLYYFSINSPSDAWDVCGASSRAASGLKLNVEIEKSEEKHSQTFPYGLTRHGYAECRRRTFWSCYLMDRFIGCWSAPLTIQAEDVFLRLPCDTNSFESQLEVQTPFFDSTTPPIPSPTWAVGSMAYIINLATICGDVMENIYRTSQRRAPASSSTFGTFYESVSRRLQTWSNTLPKALCFSAENLRKSADEGKLSTYLLMHTIYHTTQMKLNRYIQRSNLTPAQLAHHISAAHHHAESLLQIVNTPSSRQSSHRASPMGYSAPLARLNSPFVGYAIVCAIDILTARLPIAALPSRLASFNSAQSVLSDLALFWQSSKTQHALVLERIRDLSELATDKGASSKSGVKVEGFFEMRNSMEEAFSKDLDCFYG